MLLRFVRRSRGLSVGREGGPWADVDAGTLCVLLDRSPFRVNVVLLSDGRTVRVLDSNLEEVG